MHSPITVSVEVVKQRIAALLHTYPELAGDDDLRLDTIEGETDLTIVASRVLDIRAEAEANIAGIESREAELSARKDRFRRQSDGAKALLKSLMDAAGVSRLTLPEATASFVAPRASVRILAPEEVPSQLCRIKREPDKTEIGKRLVAGESIPGAALEYGETSLMIRTK